MPNKHFLLLITVKNSLRHLLETLCIINVFALTFDQFNASLLDKSINFLLPLNLTGRVSVNDNDH